jgi:hypothetical protein
MSAHAAKAACSCAGPEPTPEPALVYQWLSRLINSSVASTWEASAPCARTSMHAEDGCTRLAATELGAVNLLASCADVTIDRMALVRHELFHTKAQARGPVPVEAAALGAAALVTGSLAVAAAAALATLATKSAIGHVQQALAWHHSVLLEGPHVIFMVRPPPAALRIYASNCPLCSAGLYACGALDAMLPPCILGVCSAIAWLRLRGNSQCVDRS